MVLNRLAGQVLIGLAVWALLIIIGRLKATKYSNLRRKLIDSEGITELEEIYLYYYTYSMNFLSIAFLSIITFAFVYYLPLVLTSFFGIDNISTTILSARKYVQVLSIVVTFFGFFAYHRCDYQLEIMYEGLAK